MMKFIVAALLLLGMSAPAQVADERIEIFDAHLHYNCLLYTSRCV